MKPLVSKIIINKLQNSVFCLIKKAARNHFIKQFCAARIEIGKTITLPERDIISCLWL
jgi:hypothetical protein